VRLVEKPNDPPSDLAIVGAYAFTPLLFQAAREVKPSFRGELELTDCLQWLVDRGHLVLPYMVDGWWQDVGRPADLLVANRLLLGQVEPRIEGEVDGDSTIEGPVVIERGAQVVGSRVSGPAFIGARAVVERSTIGPHVAIGPRATARGAAIAAAIVMDEALVEGVALEGSVIGRRAAVRGGRVAVQTWLGDDGEVQLEP